MDKPYLDRLYPDERLFQAKRDAGPQLYKALYDYLHALHPASQRACAERARSLLAEIDAKAAE
jgi:hypothetical protein